jgi:hypothetical protein
MRIRENLGGLVAATSKSPVISNTKPQIGKVFGVITTKDTPTKELFEKHGGFSGIGTIFYLDYDQSKNTNTTNLNVCKVAKPFHASNQNYPLIGELVSLIDAPSPSSQINNTSSQRYYTGVINLWNNQQQNSPSGDTLGKTFIENGDIRPLIVFEGDRIYQGRKGNGIRFGSTVKSRSDINEWSSVGNDGDPITILVNGYVTTDTGSLSPNVEEINKEKSSIYITSTQKIPLQPGASIVNPRVNTIKSSDYTNSQLILNSDRITLNSKKDEILLFSKTNIELNSDNIININAGKVAHINSPSIALGTNSDGSYPTEAVLLGNQTMIAFDRILAALQNLAFYLSIAATKDGPIVAVQNGGTQLFSDIDNICDQLDKCLSTKVYTT